MQSWQALNDLRKPGGRLIYDGDGYRAVPSRRHVATGDMVDLLGHGYIRAAVDAPAGVYEITEQGRAAWTERCPRGIYGECDQCRRTQNLRPVTVGEVSIFLCDECAESAADRAQGVADRRPVVATAGRAWTCDCCGNITAALTITDGKRLCRACLRADREGDSRLREVNDYVQQA